MGLQHDLPAGDTARAPREAAITTVRKTSSTTGSRRRGGRFKRHSATDEEPGIVLEHTVHRSENATAGRKSASGYAFFKELAREHAASSRAQSPPRDLSSSSVTMASALRGGGRSSSDQHSSASFDQMDDSLANEFVMMTLGVDQQGSLHQHGAPDQHGAPHPHGAPHQQSAPDQQGAEDSNGFKTESSSLGVQESIV